MSESPSCSAKIVSVADLLQMSLKIPSYQRPYKWTRRNVQDLVNDVRDVADDRDHGKYRVGSVILHVKGDDYFIVDGQQRVVSFVLFIKALCGEIWCNSIFQDDSGVRLLESAVSRKNLCENYQTIVEALAAVEDEDRQKILRTFSDQLEVVIITIKEQSSAFQLFDSQNTRGRRLDPHDLLKAYHLRAMGGRSYDMRRAVTDWEAIPSSEIRSLFSKYLFPIMHWLRLEKSESFTDKHVDMFKGVDVDSEYTFARRTIRAMPCYQLGEQFTSGEDFFGMVAHYRELMRDLREEFQKCDGIAPLLETQGKSIGYKHAVNLFECVSLCYYDRFGRMDHDVLAKLARWAFMIHLDMFHLGFATINKYAVGDDEGSFYSNVIPMFAWIRNARRHQDVFDVSVEESQMPYSELTDEKKRLKRLLGRLLKTGGAK